MAPKINRGKGDSSSSRGNPKSRKGKSKTSYHQQGREPRRFTYEEIKRMCSETIEKGNTGKVFKGELEEGTPVVVKLYKEDNYNIGENERIAFSELSPHPLIITLIGIFVDGTQYAFVMPRMLHDLEDVLLRESDFKLEWPQLIDILCQVASAIKWIGEKNFVVGDIKPNSVLLDENYKVKLCDFGSAKKGGRDLPTTNYHYAPREVALGKGTPATDVFSFGVILLQSITRINIFKGLDRDKSIDAEVKIQKKIQQSKANKKAANSSRRNAEIPHLAIHARVQKAYYPHCVAKVFFQSACNEEAAPAITQLGLDCTEDSPGKRPSIEDVISRLEALKTK